MFVKTVRVSENSRALSEIHSSVWAVLSPILSPDICFIGAFAYAVYAHVMEQSLVQLGSIVPHTD